MATKKTTARKPSRALKATKAPAKVAGPPITAEEFAAGSRQVLDKVPPARSRPAPARRPASVNGSGHEEKPEPKAAVVETLLVPVALLMAAESIAAKVADDRPGMQGVLLHQKDGGIGRVVGSDGKRLFIGSYPVPAKPASWLKTGLMLPREDLKARVTMIAKVAGSDIVQIKHAKGDPCAYLSDTSETMLFKLAIGEVSTFPDYEGVFGIGSFTDMTEEGDMQTKREWEPVGFNSRHLKHVGEVAKILEAGMAKEVREENGMTIRVFDQGQENAPRMFDFIGCPGAMLVIAAVQLTQVALPLATARILSTAVKLTIAALRAHATRNKDAAEKATTEEDKAAFMLKAEGFEKRIAEVIARTPDLAAPAIGTDAPKPDDEKAEEKPDPVPAGVLTKAEKAAATRAKRKAAATMH